jgi:hypothetical protein
MAKTEMNAKTKKEIRALIADKIVFHKDGTFTVMQGYFYRNETPKHLAECVVENLENHAIKVSIVDTGDHWHEFVGGSPVGSATSSYIWAKFVVE